MFGVKNNSSVPVILKITRSCFWVLVHNLWVLRAIVNMRWSVTHSGFKMDTGVISLEVKMWHLFREGSLP